MKKLNIIGLSLAAILLLTACGKEEKSQVKTNEAIAGEITVLTDRTDGDNIFAEIEEKFIEKYPEVTDVKFENIADYDTTVMTRMNASDYGDVLFVPFSMAGNPEEYENYLEPLGTVADLDKDYLDVKEADYDGTVYGLPVAINALGIIYNEELLTEAGIDEVPTTIPDFEAALKAIKEKTDAVPFYSNYQAVAMWAGALTSFGGEQFKSATLEDGNAFNEGQPIREVMDLFYQMASNGFLEADPMTMDTQTAFKQMAEGKVAMLMHGSQEIAAIEAQGTDTIKMMNFPVETEGKTSLPLGAPAVIGVNKNSENKATAKAFLDFFISKESGYADDLSGMPSKIADLNAEQKETVDTSNVILTVASEEPEDEALYTQIADEVGVARLTDVLQKTINIGLYPNDNESYEDYVASLSAAWEKAAQENE